MRTYLILAIALLVIPVVDLEAIGPITYSSGVYTVRETPLITNGTVTVGGSSNVTFYSNTSLRLGPGFKVNAGALFRAAVDIYSGKLQIQSPSVVVAGSACEIILVVTNDGGLPWFGKVARATQPGDAIANFPDSFALSNFNLGDEMVIRLPFIAPPVEGTYKVPKWELTINYGWPRLASLDEVEIQVTPRIYARPQFQGMHADYFLDTNGNGLPDAVEQALDRNPAAPYVPPSGTHKNYEYDNLQRLRAAPEGTYEYDAEGNLKKARP